MSKREKLQNDWYSSIYIEFYNMQRKFSLLVLNTCTWNFNGINAVSWIGFISGDSGRIIGLGIGV